MTVTDETNLAKALAYTKTVLWITVATYDTLLWYLIKSSVGMIKTITNIDLLNIDEIVETRNGAWQRQLFLETLPIDEITKVEYNANKRWTAYRQEIDEENYVVDELWTLTFSFPLYRGHQNIKITYTTGFADFDAITRKYENLKVAMALIAWNMFNTRKQGGIASESVSWTSITYDKKAVTSDVQQLLDPYKTFAI
jgi:hypothetical protein